MKTIFLNLICFTITLNPTMIALIEHLQNLTSLEDVFFLPLVTAFIIDFQIISTVTRKRFWQVSPEACRCLLPLLIEHPFTPSATILSYCLATHTFCSGTSRRTFNILSITNKKGSSCWPQQRVCSGNLSRREVWLDPAAGH